MIIGRSSRRGLASTDLSFERSSLSLGFVAASSVESLHRSGQVVPQVPAIGDLHCVEGTQLDGLCLSAG
jgi:hypothetical protein